MREVLLFVGCCLLAGCGTMSVEERNFIRPDSLTGEHAKGRFDPAASLPAATVTEESVEVDEGVAVRGVVAVQPGAAVTILYFGGNMFHIDEHAKEILPQLAACHANVVTFDYRGYGRSAGQPTVANMQLDALRIFDRMNARFPGQVIVHGQSLGSFVAAYVASQRPVRGLVLEATASNALDWANANVPWYAKPFIKIEVSPALQRVDNVAAVTAVRAPSMVIAGGRDKITPERLGRLVYDALPAQPKRMLVGVNSGHNDMLSDAATAAAYCGFVGELASLGE